MPTERALKTTIGTILLAWLALLILLKAFYYPFEPIKSTKAKASGGFRENGHYGGSVVGVDPELRRINDFSLWGSHSGSDANTGSVSFGPFPAPREVRFFVCGYPAKTSASITLRNVTTGETIDVTPAVDPKEEWEPRAARVPKTWRNEPIVLTAIDDTTDWCGWVGVSHPYKVKSIPFGRFFHAITRPHSFQGLVSLSVIGLILTVILDRNRLRHHKRALSWALVPLALIVYGITFKPLSGYLTLFNECSLILLISAILIIPGHFVIRLVSRHRIDDDTAALAAPAATITLYGLIFIWLQLNWAEPIHYLIVNVSTTVLILSIAWKKRLHVSVQRIHPLTRFGFILAFIVAVMATSFVAVGLKAPSTQVDDWKIVANRGFDERPVDNNLPYETTLSFTTRGEPWLIEEKFGWTMGDRPPLSGVVNAIVSFTFPPWGKYPFWWYEIVGVVLNLLFVAPLCRLCGKIFTNSKVAKLATLAVLVNGFVFFNVYYTWPKLFGVYFVVMAIWLCLIWATNWKTGFCSGFIWGLGALCHGGALLSLPVPFAMFALLRFRKRPFPTIAWASCFVIGLVLTQVPWSLYKKRHPEIDTVKLIHTHYLPASFAPTVEMNRHHADDLGLMARLFFEQNPPGAQLRRRLDNVSELFAKNDFNQTLRAFLSGKTSYYYDNLYATEHHFPFSAVGELPLTICLCVLAFLVVRNGILNGESNPFNSLCDAKMAAFFAVYVVGSYVFNAFIKWNPAENVELPYVELILAIVLTSGTCFAFNTVTRTLALGLIIVRFSHLIIATSALHHFHPLDFHNLVIFGCLSLAVIFSIGISRRNGSPSFPTNSTDNESEVAHCPS